jgi:hypothetical protein
MFRILKKGFSNINFIAWLKYPTKSSTCFTNWVLITFKSLINFLGDIFDISIKLFLKKTLSNWHTHSVYVAVICGMCNKIIIIMADYHRVSGRLCCGFGILQIVKYVCHHRVTGSKSILQCFNWVTCNIYLNKTSRTF